MMTANRSFRKRIPATFVALTLMVFLLAGCGSSKGFRLAVETGGNADQKNMGEAAEQQTFFVSDDTKALPEITGEECEQLGDGLADAAAGTGDDGGLRHRPSSRPRANRLATAPIAVPA